MKKLVLGLACALAVAPAFAKMDCETLKGQITEKIEGKGVKDYSLEIVAKGEGKDGKIVGSCDGGTKEIVYRRTKGEAKAEAKPEGK
ncbi:DUF1161 domain-containing protein [Niveibacterium microcysteis]|uniref:DUF1161 domain-containing protein n=1 Tax=Niveibacterium microcysteis TaxID=2811415 RepID=A0ABX7M2H0_9RHOO|nr:DUF1161 domain-containing protein [Niveibacterium microcysteis]QSI75965.1 DUF1161 domain-containing protein [Niveibacterium microcysteis]